MKCIDCGRHSTGLRCKRCHAAHNGTAQWVYDGKEIALTGGHWYNDGGIMRWRDLS